MSTYMSQITCGYFVVSTLPTITTVELLKNVTQGITISLEVLLPCYYGEKLRSAFSDLAEGIYNMRWYEQNIRFRKHFVLLLQRAQKDEFLKAGNHIPITLQSFLTVFFKKL